MTELELFETYKWDVYRTCYYMLQDKHEAEDMMQNVFILVFSKDATAIDNLKAWIVKISINMCRNHLKRKKKGVVVENLFIMGNGDQESESIEKLLDEKEMKKAVLALLADLPERTRAILILKYLHEMKYSEIAELLDISVGTAKAGCHYGIKLLRNRISTNGMAELMREGM